MLINLFPQLAMNNRHLVELNQFAGCFHCQKIFETKLVTNYTDNGKTIICPFCNVDSVIADGSGMELTEEILQKGYNQWYKK